MRNRPDDPRWARPALLGLLAATALLYLWGLGSSGWANSFYSAAVQAGATSWKAMFFGSSDAANAITVDKTPLALWPMDLAARIFGVNTWSILVPQALEGVACVGVLFATVRRSLDGAVSRRAATAAGLLAGAILALTPVATLMFRFNNPDASLVLLLTLGVYGMVRAFEQGSTRWLAFAFSCVGLGFLAKMMQAFLVVPVFGLVWLVLAPVAFRKRLWQLGLAAVALVVSAGWWVAIVALIPASARPYIGGSQHNSVLELALGYNGLGRLNGDETGGLGNLNQEAGWNRVFSSEMGGQVSWLVPAALILLAAGVWAARSRARAALLIWGGWLLVTGLIFSFMQGIFHAYYSVALAPAVAAVVGMGTVLVWHRARGHLIVAATVFATALWSYVLLGRTTDFVPWLRWPVLVGGALAALLLLAGTTARKLIVVAGVLAVGVSLAGPAAYALDTASSAHTGAIPSAGPSSGGGMGRPGGMGGGGRAGAGGAPPAGMARNASTVRGGPGGGGPGGGGGGGGMSLLFGSTANATVTAALKKDASSYTWVAAAVGSNTAAGYQLAAGAPVMAIGGFNGTDPAPTLDRFKAYVKAGKIHYFIGGSGTGGMMGGRSTDGSQAAQEISTWVQENFTSVSLGGTTAYDLTASLSK
jgi:4-amino-4-deoxy-L-arabinose transferase-like glycosyltransferase